MILLLAACEPIPEFVEMTGIVYDAPTGTGSALPAATVDIQDTTYALTDSTTSASDGSFRVDVPAGVPFFATVSADGHVPTNFSGTSGLTDFVAPDDFPWAATEAWVAALRTEYAGCPGADEDGSALTGEVVVDAVGYPVLSNAEARLLLADETIVACYLDEYGVYDPEASTVGSLGRFAVFGVQAGEIVVDIRYTDAAADQPVAFFRFLSPENGLVPMYPTLIGI